MDCVVQELTTENMQGKVNKHYFKSVEYFQIRKRSSRSSSSEADSAKGNLMALFLGWVERIVTVKEEKIYVMALGVDHELSVCIDPQSLMQTFFALDTF